MRKRLLFLFLLVGAARAQFTTVSGTVTDPNGLAYAYGTIASTIVSSGTPLFSSNSQPYFQPTQATGLDINGKFIVRLGDNTQLTPGGSTWNFTVCSAIGTVQPAFGKGPVCFTVTGITISGASQDIGATLRAAALPLTANFGTGTGCSLLSSNANSVVYLNGTSTCTSNLDFQFVDSGTVAQLKLGANTNGGQLVLLSPTFSSINLNAPQLSSGDASWFTFQGRAVSVGASSAGGNVGISQNNNLGPQTITAISRTSNVVTVTFTSAFSSVFPVGGFVNIAGVTNATFNCAVCKVVSSAAGSLTYAQTAANASSSGGTISFFASNAVASTNSSNNLTLLGSVSGNGQNADGSYPPAVQILSGGTNVNGTSGGDILIEGGGSQDTGADATEPAGNINLTGGSASGGNNAGGNINLTAGSASGTGAPGVIGLLSNTKIQGHLNQGASGNFGGSCTMASSTTCTFSLTTSYTSPLCVATEQALVVVAGACTVSGTTVTITAASSNSGTWAALVFGNPN